MKKIKLTQGKYTIVDDKDFKWLNQWKWFVATGGKHRKNMYARRYDTKNKRTVHMHRLIANTPESMITDHINGNSLDNRRTNLRVCTTSENIRNARKYINNSSGYRGVQKNWRKWRARIFFEGKYVNLGFYKTPEEAAKAYNDGAIKYYGQFARLNNL